MKSRSRTCSTPPLISTARKCPGPTTISSPKSVLRDMLESASDFKGYIQKLGIARPRASCCAT